MKSNFVFFADRPSCTYKKCDSTFVILTFLLWGLGIITLYFSSAGYGERAFNNSFHFVQRQLISSLIGFLGLLFFSWTSMNKVRKLLPFIVFGALILCLMTFLPVVGLERNGARRWIKLPYFSTFQPSEAAKFAIVLFLANLFDKNEELPKEERTVLPAFLGLMFFTIVIFAQQDFSTGLFVFIIGLILFFITGAKLSWFIPCAGLGLPSVALMILLKPYRVNRLVGFFAQDAYQQSLNYQLNNAKKAISAGGFWGQGIGSGLTKINNIPEIQSDYIFAGWTEAMGFMGVIIYLVLLGMFAYRALKISMSCGNRFAAIVSFGFASVITLQSLLNIGVVGGVLPSTGVPLPFFSSGGSSMIFTLSMCGFIINASRIEQIDDYEIVMENKIYE